MGICASCLGGARQESPEVSPFMKVFGEGLDFQASCSMRITSA
jgi:hypothetical protein